MFSAVCYLIRSGVRTLRRFFRRERAYPCRTAVGFADNSHLLPVIGQFFTAIEANNIGARDGRRAIAARSRTNRLRKTVMRMPASEERVQKPTHHTSTSPEHPVDNSGCNASASALPEWLDSNPV